MFPSDDVTFGHTHFLYTDAVAGSMLGSVAPGLPPYPYSRLFLMALQCVAPTVCAPRSTTVSYAVIPSLEKYATACAAV